MSGQSMTLIERRRVEADTLAAMYHELLQTQSERFALESIARTVSAMAFANGKAFAAQAADEPNLRHFSSILEKWQGSGALGIEDVRETADELRFTVRRCAYAELYQTMNLPAVLVPVLSCARDAPFARGYSPRLQFLRKNTIAQGAPFCDFLFRWQD